MCVCGGGGGFLGHLLFKIGFHVKIVIYMCNIMDEMLNYLFKKGSLWTLPYHCHH